MERYAKLKKYVKGLDVKSLILTLFLLMIVGYALIQMIKGTFGFKPSWDVYFDNITQVSSSDSLVEPVIANSSDKIGINFSTVLKKLDSFYEFEVDIVNSGDIDAEIYSLTMNITPDKFSKYYNYTFTDLDGKVVKVEDVIPAKSSKRIKMKVMFSDKKNLTEVIDKNYAKDDGTVNFICDIGIRRAS